MLEAAASAISSRAIAFTILFQANPRDVGWVALAAFAAFGAARSGPAAAGPEMGAFVGALIVGLISNLHARLGNRSSTLMLVPGYGFEMSATTGAGPRPMVDLARKPRARQTPS